MKAKSLSEINIFTLSINSTYEIRSEILKGQEHWVLPVIMMVEGVHAGSLGPLLYTAQELGKITAAWNGIPVTIHHPQIDGIYTSANLPELADTIVGNIYHARMEDGKLKAEAWVNVAVLQEVSMETYTYIQEQKALDVSVGVFSEEINVPGTFNGERYRAAATNLRPDHLAILPGVEGACSWDDGCGIRNNKKLSNMKEFDKKMYVNSRISVVNEKGFREIMYSIQSKLDRLDNDVRVHMLEDIYDGFFVYAVRSRESGEMSFYKRDYSVMQDGSIEFGNDPVKVKKDISYVAMKEQGSKKINSNKTEKKMTRKLNANQECTCNVDNLIANEATPFTEEDREWLSTLKQEQLEKLMPAKVEEVAPVVANAAPVKKAEKKEEAAPVEASLVKVAEDGSISINGKSIDQYVKESLGKETDSAKFIDNFMPDGLKGQMKAGLKMYQDKRASQIAGIVSNSKFKAEQLAKWSDEDLTALHESLVDTTVDYSANLGFNANKGADEESADEITAMLSFEKKVEKK